MNSFNHYGLGSVGDWLYRTVGGVAPAAPGYQRVLIAPRPGGTLTSATSDLDTAYGRTRSSWTKVDGKLTLRVTIPPNASGIVRLPSPAVRAPAAAVPLDGGSFFVPGGSHTFTA
jgi:alpha-L-rhamnosidase